MSSEEQQITMNKPEKNPKRVAAGKNLANYNKTAKKMKELGEMSEEPTRPKRSESNCENDDDEMDGTTKVLVLAGLAGLAYHLYTTSDSKNEGVKKKSEERPSVQDNNDVQENNVNRLRSFKT